MKIENPELAPDGSTPFRMWTLGILTAFAVAMALLESAVVVYARRLYYPENPMELFPLHFLKQYDPVLELSREVATIVMIITVALLAERSKNLTRKFAAFVFVFGTWDLFYYVWLKVLMDWPRTWLEWDVLFLIPMVWLGPWICPALIALLFMIWGAWVLGSPYRLEFTRIGVAVFAIGAIIGLVAFMQPAASVTLQTGPEGLEKLSQYVPGKFWWWLYIPSLLLMAIGFALTKRQIVTLS